MGRVLVFFFMGLLWPLVWAGKGISIILSARKLQDPRILQVSGLAHIIRHGDTDFMLQITGIDFDVDKNPSGVIMEGNEYTIHYLEATEEILSVEPLTSRK